MYGICMMRRLKLLVFPLMAFGAIFGRHHNRDELFVLNSIRIGLFRLVAIIAVDPRLSHGALPPLVINAGSGFAVTNNANFSSRRTEFFGINKE